MKSGRFITIEGVEGVGKSTNLSLIESLVSARGFDVLVTREPGGTMTGERIRKILLDKEEQAMTAMTELLLMFAARKQHVEEVIKPALSKGVWVISDRFTDSSYAYQGGGRQLGSKKVAKLEELVLNGFKPDLTLLLDLDVTAGLARATSDSSPDRFESEEREFFERVRTVFLARSKYDHYRVINSAQSMEAVQVELRKVIASFCDGL
ncbi:MAG TPA: dTMP kinase [Gammaproteobacteria bacterium]|nr:dTMP kinase [Gammaproteobacteria bacterium]